MSYNDVASCHTQGRAEAMAGAGGGWVVRACESESKAVSGAFIHDARNVHVAAN